MSSIQPQCPPLMNTDVSGIGVRISFYLQTLFLLLLSLDSNSLDGVTASVYTLSVTNVSMVVTALISGSKGREEISLQDALVIFYLLSMSWVAVIFSMTNYNRFWESNIAIKAMSIVQSYFLLGCALAFLSDLESFGSTPTCNPSAKVAFFGSFDAVHTGQIFGLCLITFAGISYTAMTILDCFPAAKCRLIVNLDSIFCRRASTRSSSSSKEGSPCGDDRVNIMMVVDDLELQAVATASGSSNEASSTVGISEAPSISDSDVEKFYSELTGAKSATGSSADIILPTSNSSVRDSSSVAADTGLESLDPLSASTGQAEKLYHVVTAHEPTLKSQASITTSDQEVTATRSSESTYSEEGARGVKYGSYLKFAFSVVLWLCAVANTELLIARNKSPVDEESQWQFGQILSMFLTVLPFTNLLVSISILQPLIRRVL